MGLQNRSIKLRKAFFKCIQVILGSFVFFQVAGVLKVGWWAPRSNVCYQRSVCVRWQVYSTGQASKSNWIVRFVFVREEDLRDVSPTRTAQVRSVYSEVLSTFCTMFWKKSLNKHPTPFQCTVAGHHGLRGESVWDLVVFRVYSGHFAAQIIPPITETGKAVEEFTEKHVGNYHVKIKVFSYSILHKFSG